MRALLLDGKSWLGFFKIMTREKTMGAITLPKIRGGVVTRMSVLPVNGAISDMEIETSGSSISFPEEIRFDLNAKIHIQRIIIIGGSDRTHQ